jgi:hypothetical protein
VALVKIASLWESKGKSMFTGMMDQARLIVLKNSKKDKEKSPDAYVYIAVDDDDSKGKGKGKKSQDDADPGCDDGDCPF